MKDKMTVRERLVDKPKLGLANYVLISVEYLAAFIVLIWGWHFYLRWDSPVFLVMAPFFLIGTSYLLYGWINTIYEFTDSQLKIRSGFYKKDISLESITGVRVNRRYSSGNYMPPVVKFRDRVWLIGPNVMITPNNPVVFVEELNRRIPKLEVGGISSAYRSLNAEDLYRKLLDLYIRFWGGRLGGTKELENKIQSCVKQGLNREDAIRKIAEWEFEGIPF